MDGSVSRKVQPERVRNLGGQRGGRLRAKSLGLIASKGDRKSERQDLRQCRVRPPSPAQSRRGLSKQRTSRKGTDFGEWLERPGDDGRCGSWVGSGRE